MSKPDNPATLPIVLCDAPEESNGPKQMIWLNLGSERENITEL